MQVTNKEGRDMGFRGRHKNRRDANEADLVAELRAHGFSVYMMDQPLDLLVGYAGRTYLVEIKTEKGKLTDPQLEFLAHWRGDATVLRTSTDVKLFARMVKGVPCDG
jgi:hypothetical protein